MLLLLDTHLLLWAAYEPERLSAEARGRIGDVANDLLFSSASIWEVSIKSSLARGDFSVNPRILRRGLMENGYRELPITSAHAIAVSDLPPIHQDPFDRILVAQARTEGLELLTADAKVLAYGEPVIGVG
ncbi:type II toxin-antitoxin system VapC family toxin [Brevibacterium marinum]|uniref:PIN domain nuclease of toxin-antitoxin system n=1 Tax=Brevibacterium marinum TaxID=418643 RepID=A0A846S1K3_9MICO|nr:type II toxin-antitoxin system VapC family toxin [Brevibacterium marinum]NJC55462.1 PIN domain nuclease of toxin-antitoxin system [Brevibacterium marinum]